MSQAQIAKLLKVSIAAVERAIKEHKLKAIQPLRGEYNRAAFQHFVRATGKRSLALPTDVAPADLWIAIRKILQREVPLLFKEGVLALRRLDGFLQDLPYILAAAKARLTPSRLWLLHDDLDMSVRDIAEVLDAPLSAVKEALARADVERGGRNPHPIHDYWRLAQALGRADLPVEHSDRDSAEHAYRRMTLAAREGVRALAKSGAIDWSAVDRFLVEEGERRR